jgi:hypothetical protein
MASPNVHKETKNEKLFSMTNFGSTLSQKKIGLLSPPLLGSVISLGGSIGSFGNYKTESQKDQSGV